LQQIIDFQYTNNFQQNSVTIHFSIVWRIKEKLYIFVYKIKKNI